MTKHITHFARKGFLLLLLAGMSIVFGACSSHPAYMVTDADESLANWHQARYFQAQGRYELAREHFLLALAAARADGTRDALTRELHAVDLQIKTLR